MIEKKSKKSIKTKIEEITITASINMEQAEAILRQLVNAYGSDQLKAIIDKLEGEKEVS